jgi:vesicle transport protein SEC22
VFTDSRARRNLSALNTELQDVQRIMVQNIDDVLQRGVVLSGNSESLLVFHYF